MTDQTLAPTRSAPLSPAATPALVACGAYALLLALGPRLLNDPDSYWHVTIGRWIISHRAVPHADIYSHTFAGAPWIAKEWLSQVLYAAAHDLAGWAGVVALAAGAAALALGLLAHALTQRLAPTPALIGVLCAFVLAAPHLLARPHALALPVLVIWAVGLLNAAESARAPSLWLLAVMTLWANLHGGFTFGLALLAPMAFEALWNGPAHARMRLAGQWLAFAALAVAAACVTPYGPESILVTGRVLGLGEALSIIGEWRPQDFSRVEPFELLVLGNVGAALYLGVRLPPLRIAMVLGLVHMALAHVRHAELLGLLAPLFLAGPLARQFSALRNEPHAPSVRPATAATLLTVGMTAGYMATQAPTPAAASTPSAAVAALRTATSGPVLNDYWFGGYMIAQGVSPFIDGRTELYGGAFTMRHHRAVTLQNLPDFLQLLNEHRVGATLLAPTTPAVALLDRLPGWRRLHADDIAVVHVRVP